MGRMVVELGRRNIPDNGLYLKDFALHLVGKSEKPIAFYPPTYQQIAFLIDRGVSKIKKISIPFNQPCIWGPKSKELEEIIEDLSILGFYSPVLMEKTGDALGLERAIYAREEPYTIIHEGPPLGILEPVIIGINAATQAKRYLSNKIHGKKNLPDEYIRAEKELKEKFLGKTGLKEMDILIEELTQLPKREIYELASEIYLEENPSKMPVLVTVPT